MEINGTQLQLSLIKNLKFKIENLKLRGITPGIAIVTLGAEETWEAYVKQKLKLAQSLNLNSKLIKLNTNNTSEVISVIEKLNNDNTIHGLIVQRPFPPQIDTEKVIQSVSAEKDIDGFKDNSPFEVPVWLAVKCFLTQASQLLNEAKFQEWLSNQAILIVGKGETAGKPVISALQKLNIQPQIIDSKTKDPKTYFESADIIIFATGKKIDIPYQSLKKTSILIGIGLHRENGKLVGDFNENEVKNRVLYYTPSPGGVGPINLYYLFENLVAACQNQS